MTDETPKLGDRDQIKETLDRIEAAKQAVADQGTWDLFFSAATLVVFKDEVAENSIGCEVAADLADLMLAERNRRRAK